MLKLASQGPLVGVRNETRGMTKNPAVSSTALVPTSDNAVAQEVEELLRKRRDLAENAEVTFEGFGAEGGLGRLQDGTLAPGSSLSPDGSHTSHIITHETLSGSIGVKSGRGQRDRRGQFDVDIRSAARCEQDTGGNLGRRSSEEGGGGEVKGLDTASLRPAAAFRSFVGRRLPLDLRSDFALDARALGLADGRRLAPAKAEPERPFERVWRLRREVASFQAAVFAEATVISQDEGVLAAKEGTPSTSASDWLKRALEGGADVAASQERPEEVLPRVPGAPLPSLPGAAPAAWLVGPPPADRWPLLDVAMQASVSPYPRVEEQPQGDSGPQAEKQTTRPGAVAEGAIATAAAVYRAQAPNRKPLEVPGKEAAAALEPACSHRGALGEADG